MAIFETDKFDIAPHVKAVEEETAQQLAKRFREIWQTDSTDAAFLLMAREAVTHDNFCIVMIQEMERVLRDYHSYIDALESKYQDA